MRRLERHELDLLRDKTIDLILRARAMHLRSPQANVLKHWDQIHDRMKGAVLRNDSVEGWATELLRELGVPSPNKYLSSAIVELTDIVREHDCMHEWRQMVRRESSYIMAKARLIADQRRAEYEAEAEAAEHITDLKFEQPTPAGAEATR